MTISKMQCDTLYKNVLNTIIDLMKENNVTSIPMKGTCFGKAGWVSLNLDKDDVLYYLSKIVPDEEPFKIRFEFDNPQWYFSIHRLDLAPLLETVIIKLNDEICVEEI